MSSGEELIARMAAGDRDAFAAFYDRHAPAVHALIRRIVREPQDAADVVQEVFWEAWQSAGGYQASRGSPEAWIFTRARSRAIDRVRSVRRRSETFVAPLAGAEGGPAASPDPAEAVADRTAIRGALAGLPERERQVIELAYYGGLTQTEIAARLAQPLGTIKTRMRAGLERLRGALRPGQP
jgi:RNA polymerase sigma-70 factor (ECF subfamily)